MKKWRWRLIALIIIQEALLERIIKACSNDGDTVLDLFSGSGTTCYVAKKLKRNYIGIEKDKEFLIFRKEELILFNSSGYSFLNIFSDCLRKKLKYKYLIKVY